MRKDLGAGAFGFGWPVPVLMVATYNDDGSVNVMNLHEAMRTNAGDLALCIGPRSKTHENVEKLGMILYDSFSNSTVMSNFFPAFTLCRRRATCCCKFSSRPLKYF